MAELKPQTSRSPLHEGYLWPSADYDRQLAGVCEAIGQTVYLVRIEFSDINLSVTLENKAVTLLDVVSFPAPDPARRLYPHMLILSDGRGINLGHIARLSRDQAFDPKPEQIVYQQDVLVRHWLFRERRLSPQTIRHTSQVQLARMLGRVEPRKLK